MTATPQNEAPRDQILKAIAEAVSIPASQRWPSPSERTLGWRVWTLQGDVTLTGGFVTSLNAPIPGWSKDGFRACCMEFFLIPDAYCTCGVRAMVDLDVALRVLRADPRRMGVGRLSWVAAEHFWPGYLADRTRHGVLDVPDVIGQVEGWGRQQPGNYGDMPGGDAPGTLRFEFGRVGRRLHLSVHLAHRAEQLARKYDVHVVVGASRGLPWLEEIADYETAGRWQSTVPGVTWLGPVGRIPPAVMSPVSAALQANLLRLSRTAP